MVLSLFTHLSYSLEKRNLGDLVLLSTNHVRRSLWSSLKQSLDGLNTLESR
jgi:hypothetical protein